MRRMVEAALELIAEGGLDGASVHAIVDRAGASVGSFYARFDSRDDLLGHLRGRVWGRARERWAAAVVDRRREDSLGLRAEVAWACRVLLTLLVEDPVRRAFLLEDAEARGLESDLQAEIRRDLVGLLQRHREEMGHPDPDFAVEFGLRLILGGAREILAAAPGDSGGVSERAHEELARVFGDYLRGGPVGSPAHAEPPVADQIDPFDVWG
jgi:AcrR family transcriptional regulator